MTDEVDLKLTALLAAPDRPPDERFAFRVQQTIIADERLRAARRRAWRRLASEAAATGTLMLAFLVLVRLQPSGTEGLDLPLFSPAMIGVLLLGLWVIVTLRSGATGRG